MHQESSNATLRYGREELLNLRRDFNIIQSQRVILGENNPGYYITQLLKRKSFAEGQRVSANIRYRLSSVLVMMRPVIMPVIITSHQLICSLCNERSPSAEQTITT